MGNGNQKRKRRPPPRRPAGQQPTRRAGAAASARASFPRRAAGWMFTTLSGLLVTVLGGALTTGVILWVKSVADNSGPALAAIADVEPLSASCYALTQPVTSAADRVTLLSGTASAAQVSALLTRHGAVNVGRMDVTLILEGRRASLRIVNIAPQVLSARAAPSAALLRYVSAGSLNIIRVTADLNRPVPVLRTSSGPYFSTQEIDLAHGERESFRISFRAATGFYEFNLLVTYVTRGQQYTQTIPGPAGGRFRLVGRDDHDFRTVYAGVGLNQFEVASRSQQQAILGQAGC